MPSAIQVLSKCLSKHPLFFPVRLCKAKFLALEGKYEEALEEYSTLESQKCTENAVRLGKAECLRNLGEREKSLSVLEGVEMGGGESGGRGRVRLLVEKGEYERAERCIDEVFIE